MFMVLQLAMVASVSVDYIPWPQPDDWNSQ